MALLITVGGAYAQSPDHKATGATKDSASLAGQTAGAKRPAEHRSAAKADSSKSKDNPVSAQQADKTANPGDQAKPQKAAQDKNASAQAGDKASQQASQQGSQDQHHGPAQNGKQAQKQEQNGKQAQKQDKSNLSTGRSVSAGRSDDKSGLQNSDSKAGPNGQNQAHDNRGARDKTAGATDRNHDQTSSVQLDSQKQERIRTALSSTNVKNIENVNFDVSVGTRVPRRYHFHSLPTQIVDIVPQYRGYDYMMVKNEIVIVNPHTRKVVYTMNEGRSAAMNHRSVDCR